MSGLVNVLLRIPVELQEACMSCRLVGANEKDSAVYRRLLLIGARACGANIRNGADEVLTGAAAHKDQSKRKKARRKTE